MLRAAYRINGVVRVGDSHLQIITELAGSDLSGDVEHGYLSPVGSFFSGIEELFQFMRNVYLIRHAQSLYNIQASTDLDSGLSALGQEQAERLAEHLKGVDLTGYIGYVSPFLRTLLTAQPIARKTGLKFRVWPSLAEYATPWTVHECYNVKVPVRKEMFPEFDWSYYTDPKHFTEETAAQFHKRMEEIVHSDLPDHVVLVTHGAIVWTVAALLLGNVFGSYGDVPNASLTCIEAAKAVCLFKVPLTAVPNQHETG